jgi:hypothetical protein
MSIKVEGETPSFNKSSGDKRKAGDNVDRSSAKTMKAASGTSGGRSEAIIDDNELLNMMLKGSGKGKVITELTAKGKAESKKSWKTVFTDYQNLGYFTLIPISSNEEPNKTKWTLNETGQQNLVSLNTARETVKANNPQTMLRKFDMLDKAHVEATMKRVNYNMIRACQELK